MTTTRILAAAVAAVALAVPATAQAQPADQHASATIAATQARQQAQPIQDLRSPDSRDAARPRPAVRPAPVDPKPVAVAHAAHAVATTHDGVDWTTVLIGIGGSLLAIGAIALVADHRRAPRLRANV